MDGFASLIRQGWRLWNLRGHGRQTRDVVKELMWYNDLMCCPLPGCLPLLPINQENGGAAGKHLQGSECSWWSRPEVSIFGPGYVSVCIGFEYSSVHGPQLLSRRSCGCWGRRQSLRT